MKKIRFLIIAAGFLLPLVIELFFVLIQDPEILLPKNNMIGTFFMAGLWGGIFNIIPFILLYILIKNKPGVKNLPELGMVIAVVSASIFFNSIYFIDLTGNSPSSTGVLLIFVMPIYISLAIPFGYLGGLIIQFFVRKKG